MATSDADQDPTESKPAAGKAAGSTSPAGRAGDRTTSKRAERAAARKEKKAQVVGNRWAAPAMLACWLVGLAWVSTYYILGENRFPGDLGNYNILIGMGLIAFGFVFATQWE